MQSAYQIKLKQVAGKNEFYYPQLIAFWGFLTLDSIQKHHSRGPITAISCLMHLARYELLLLFLAFNILLSNFYVQNHYV